MLKVLNIQQKLQIYLKEIKILRGLIEYEKSRIFTIFDDNGLR